MHPQDYDRMLDDARLRAYTLRTEAIDRFWAQVVRRLRAGVKKAAPRGRFAGRLGSPPARG